MHLTHNHSKELLVMSQLCPSSEQQGVLDAKAKAEVAGMDSPH